MASFQDDGAATFINRTSGNLKGGADDLSAIRAHTSKIYHRRRRRQDIQQYQASRTSLSQYYVVSRASSALLHRLTSFYSMLNNTNGLPVAVEGSMAPVLYLKKSSRAHRPHGLLKIVFRSEADLWKRLTRQTLSVEPRHCLLYGTDKLPVTKTTTWHIRLFSAVSNLSNTWIAGSPRTAFAAIRLIAFQSKST